jgi:hypothetical protein
MERGLGHYFGLFHDANSLLTFKQLEYIDVHDHVATLKRARDVGLNLIQAKLVVSFQNQVPLFFGKGTPTKTSSLMRYPTRQATGRKKTAPAEQNTILIVLSRQSTNNFSPTSMSTWGKINTKHVHWPTGV